LNEETKWLTEGNPAYRRFYMTETYDLNIFDDGDRQPRMEDFRESAFGVILGMTGSGKSNAAAVLMESFLTKRMPIVVVDIKNEFYTLREKYPITVIGEFEHYDERLSQNDPKALAARVIHGKESIILSFFQVPKPKIYSFCIPFFQELYELEKIARYPIMIFIEESQMVIPQNYPSEFKMEVKQLKERLKEIALRGRSVGIAIFFISQRSQSVDKEIISSASHMLLHRVNHPRDLNVYKDLIPYDFSEISYMVPKLARGTCVYIFGGQAQIRKVRKKYSRDVAQAPGYDKILRWVDGLRENEDEEYPENNKSETEVD